MPCGLSPNQILPRRYVVRPGVASPLTCRHPRHVACGCHGQPAAQKPGNATRNTQSAAADPKAAANAHAEALRQQEQEYKSFLARILYTIRCFPEAAAAVSAMLQDGPPVTPEPDHPDSGNA